MTGWAVLVAFVYGLFVAGPAFACGPDTDCRVEGGTYRVRPPAGWDGHTALPAAVFFVCLRGGTRRCGLDGRDLGAPVRRGARTSLPVGGDVGDHPLLERDLLHFARHGAQVVKARSIAYRTAEQNRTRRLKHVDHLAVML